MKSNLYFHKLIKIDYILILLMLKIFFFILENCTLKKEI